MSAQWLSTHSFVASVHPRLNSSSSAAAGPSSFGGLGDASDGRVDDDSGGAGECENGENAAPPTPAPVPLAPAPTPTPTPGPAIARGTPARCSLSHRRPHAPSGTAPKKRGAGYTMPPPYAASCCDDGGGGGGGDVSRGWNAAAGLFICAGVVVVRMEKRATGWTRRTSVTRYLPIKLGAHTRPSSRPAFFFLKITSPAGLWT
ncbi:hypothetical protein B0H11DRAFT_1924479 [Mycena galericulata]|nr:hypothetical protein B0H11DRAFT_1924479 [Mycena galericulata]